MTSASAPIWHALTTRRIYFGHQSVGQNIIDGIAELCKESGVPLRLHEVDQKQQLSRPAFTHARLGVNGDPNSKIDAFAAALRDGVGDAADIAFFKFCYVDVTAATDVQELFRLYAVTMARLTSEYRNTLFVHVTVPLTVASARWRYWANHLMNRPFTGNVDNASRNRFNALMRSTYLSREPLFDLAQFETGVVPNAQKDSDGERWALDRQLTSDGGHLNARGRRRVGGALLDFLATLPAMGYPGQRFELRTERHVT